MSFKEKLSNAVDIVAGAEESSWETPDTVDSTPSVISPERLEQMERYLAKGGLKQALLASRRLSEIERDK